VNRDFFKADLLSWRRPYQLRVYSYRGADHNFFLTWKISRFAALGRETIWEQRPESAESFVELVRRRGEAHVTMLNNKPAAVTFVFPIGKTVFVPQASFDPRYAHFSLGFIAVLGAIHTAIEHGTQRVNLMWGEGTFKENLGARPVRATRLSVFRSEIARVHSLGEASEVGIRRLKRGKGYYFRTRHVVGKMLRATVRRSRATTPK
jgi:CelD/BcsL family acetyltransferase involved in cellulose biosynthesis